MKKNIAQVFPPSFIEAYGLQSSSASIVGTYFTVLNSVMGPIIVVGQNNTVTVDGVVINGAIVVTSSESTTVSWSAQSGNPSSAALVFAYSTQQSAMICGGEYWTSGQTQPTQNNIYGFNTTPPKPLSDWAGTYQAYQMINGTNQSMGNLIISSDTVVYLGKSIQNPIYTGMATTNGNLSELSWYTEDGNDANVSVCFGANGSDNVFSGYIWTTGDRPVGTPNFSGTTGGASDVAAAANHNVAEYVGAAGATIAAVAGIVQAAKATAGAGEAAVATADDAAAEAAPAVAEAAAPAAVADAAEAATAVEEAAPAVAEAAAPAVAEAVAPAVAEAAAPEAAEVAADVLIALAALAFDARIGLTPPPSSQNVVSQSPSGQSVQELLSR